MITAVIMSGKRKLEYDQFLSGLLSTRFDGDLTRFARKADMSYSQAHDVMVNGITDGRRLGTLKKIAEAFGISVDQLITGENE